MNNESIEYKLPVKKVTDDIFVECSRGFINLSQIKVIRETYTDNGTLLYKIYFSDSHYILVDIELFNLEIKPYLNIVK